MERTNMIEITGVNLIDFAKRVYDLSRPQGLGFLHFKEGDMDAATEQWLSERIASEKGRIALSMDYVSGRACKMTVFRDDDGTLWIDDSWFDHGNHLLNELLKTFGLKREQGVA
jgi:hypothetical protein